MTEPSPEVLQKLTPVLTKRWLEPDAYQIDVYERLDGYRALRKVLDVHPGHQRRHGGPQHVGGHPTPPRHPGGRVAGAPAALDQHQLTARPQ